jgi:hypothetical protein
MAGLLERLAHHRALEIQAGLLQSRWILPRRLDALEAEIGDRDPMVVQMQIAKRQDAVPLTRAYVTAWSASISTPPWRPKDQRRSAHGVWCCLTLVT